VSGIKIKPYLHVSHIVILKFKQNWYLVWYLLRRNAVIRPKFTIKDRLLDVKINTNKEIIYFAFSVFLTSASIFFQLSFHNKFSISQLSKA